MTTDSRDIIATSIGSGHVAERLETSWRQGDVHLAVKGWQGAEAELFQKSGWHSLILTIRGGTALTGSKVGGQLVYEGIDRPGALTFVPADADRTSWYVNADLDYAGLFIHPRLAKEIGAIGHLAGLGPRVNATDDLIAGVMASLSRDLAGDIQPDRAFMDACVDFLARQLDRTDRRAPPVARRARHLSQRTIRTVRDFVEAHLANEISLQDMAAVSGLPSDSFARCFRASLGVAPYQYVQERRIRNAEALLAGSALPISEIALDCGFSSQSHLNKAFKRLTGHTPGSYRRLAGGLDGKRTILPVMVKDSRS